MSTDRDNKMRIKKFLGQHCISVTDMAKQMGYSPSHVRNCLNERSITPELLVSIEAWMKEVSSK
jgi:plasmid maintenance system antidote protein VapI